MIKKFKNIVIALSGGVDSAVSAYFLKKNGYNVIAAFMKNWDIPNEIGHCTTDFDLDDARGVCKKLDIPLIEVNFVKEYWNYVFEELIADYESGFTPNPDILCNRFIKFNYFFRYAIDKLKMDAIATGHYARTSFGPFLDNFTPEKNVHLLRCKDEIKDQTFFLSQVNQNALRKTMFPVGNYMKSEIRKIAHGLNLDVADKRDSTGICFIGKRNFHNFISEYLPDKPGPFIDIETGKQVGNHLGLHYWTLGQGARLAGNLMPYFIARKDVKTNTIYVAAGTNNLYLQTKSFFTCAPHWIDPSQKFLTSGTILSCQFRFQHAKPLFNCILYINNTRGLIAYLEEPVRSITPGQYAVFYKQEQCLGSARISTIGPNSYELNNFNKVENLNEFQEFEKIVNIN